MYIFFILPILIGVIILLSNFVTRLKPKDEITHLEKIYLHLSDNVEKRNFDLEHKIEKVVNRNIKREHYLNKLN